MQIRTVKIGGFTVRRKSRNLKNAIEEIHRTTPALCCARARGFGDAGWAAAAACEGWVMLTRENTRHDAVAKIISYRNPAPVEYEELANELIARE